jgi:aminoglycoside phosphotransferase (APT) family kinase protein
MTTARLVRGDAPAGSSVILRNVTQVPADPAATPIEGADTSIDSGGDVPGVRVPAVTAWLESHVPHAVGPFRFDLIAGGHSNLTYRVTAADGHRVVLRRPPLGHRLASAHDMGREHRIISSLAATGVPVAPALGYCDDEEVSDAPFYVMGFVEGHVLRDRQTAEAVLDVDQRAHASISIVDTMAAIHAVDLAGAGLADLARHEGYIERQLKRWYGQWNAHIPEQGAATLVHGDYRLDNCMVGPDGTVVAVLDWEICTLGDPLADVGLLQVYWTGPDDEPSAWAGDATTAPGFAGRAELAERYAATSGRDISDLPFYVAFGFWKLACVLEGVYARYLGGALGARSRAELEPFERQVENAVASAVRILESMR